MKLMKHNYLQQNMRRWVSDNVNVFVCFPLQIHDEISIYWSDADSSVWKGEPVFSSVILNKFSPLCVSDKYAYHKLRKKIHDQCMNRFKKDKMLFFFFTEIILNLKPKFFVFKNVKVLEAAY